MVRQDQTGQQTRPDRPADQTSLPVASRAVQSGCVAVFSPPEDCNAMYGGYRAAVVSCEMG